jgi:hypothetical protein
MALSFAIKRSATRLSITAFSTVTSNIMALDKTSFRIKINKM